MKRAPHLSVCSVFHSQMLWKIYGTIAATVMAALFTVALVFLTRSPVLELAQTNELMTSLMVATMGGAAVALIFGYWLASGVQQSLTEVTTVAQSLSCGEFSARVKVLSNDEFGLLGLTLNMLGEEISERMAALSQERTQLAAVFSGMVEGIVAIGDDDRVLFANGAADRFLHAPASESRGRQMSEVPGLGILLPLVIQCRKEKKRKQTELTIGDGDGVLFLETHVSPFKGEQNAGVVVVLHDVTELRNLERIRRDFVANVSHELKTPLTSIKGYVEALLSGAQDDPERRTKFLQRMEANVDRLVELVQDILSLARAETQESFLKKAPVDLSGIARQAIVHHEHVVTAKSIALQLNLEEDVVIQGDREAVRQIIDNLLMNAIKYTPDGGKVTLNVKRRDTLAELTVVDTGVGISVEHHHRIFERFYRVDRHRNREDGGTGLGLSIVKHLVHSMNGRVSVDSAPGSGSAFMVQMKLHKS